MILALALVLQLPVYRWTPPDSVGIATYPYNTVRVMGTVISTQTLSSGKRLRVQGRRLFVTVDCLTATPCTTTAKRGDLVIVLGTRYQGATAYWIRPARVVMIQRQCLARYPVQYCT